MKAFFTLLFLSSLWLWFSCACLTPTAVAASLGTSFSLLLSTPPGALMVFSYTLKVCAASVVSLCFRLTQPVALLDGVCPNSGLAAPPSALLTDLEGIHTLDS